MVFYYMRHEQYTTRYYYPVCINLEQQHIDFLKELANRHRNNYSKAIYYLVNKYLNHLYLISITPIKKTETANYQPKTRRYKKRVININPVLWSKLFEMRHFIGYSISALIRIMLDWEMQSQGYDIIPLIPLPTLNAEVINNSNQDNNTIVNNYSYFKKGFYEQRKVISIFLDQFV
jgi:hypothetical protein